MLFGQIWSVSVRRLIIECKLDELTDGGDDGDGVEQSSSIRPLLLIAVVIAAIPAVLLHLLDHLLLELVEDAAHFERKIPSHRLCAEQFDCGVDSFVFEVTESSLINTHVVNSVLYLLLDARCVCYQLHVSLEAAFFFVTLAVSY